MAVVCVGIEGQASLSECWRFTTHAFMQVCKHVCIQNPAIESQILL